MSQHSSKSFHVSTIPQKFGSERMAKQVGVELAELQLVSNPPENAIQILPDQGFAAFLAE